jgi:hypothetical protein
MVNKLKRALATAAQAFCCWFRDKISAEARSEVAGRPPVNGHSATFTSKVTLFAPGPRLRTSSSSGEGVEEVV